MFDSVYQILNTKTSFNVIVLVYIGKRYKTFGNRNYGCKSIHLETITKFYRFYVFLRWNTDLDFENLQIRSFCNIASFDVQIDSKQGL